MSSFGFPTEFSSGLYSSQPVFQQNGPSVGSRINNAPMKHPHELFVGDLSFFCEERDLAIAFSQFGHVDSCRIVRNEGKRRSLMFGFVCMSTRECALQAIEAMNEQMFLGRIIKVELSANRPTQSSQASSQHVSQSSFVEVGYQVHLALSSNFDPSNIVKPTEIFLRDVFLRFGNVLDVVVRDYTVYQNTRRQEGYSFLTFEEEESAVFASHYCKSIVVEGIHIACTFSVRNRPTGRVYDLGGGNVFVSQGRDSKMFINGESSQPQRNLHFSEPTSGQKGNYGGGGNMGMNMNMGQKNQSWGESSPASARGMGMNQYFQHHQSLPQQQYQQQYKNNMNYNQNGFGRHMGFNQDQQQFNRPMISDFGGRGQGNFMMGGRGSGMNMSHQSGGQYSSMGINSRNPRIPAPQYGNDGANHFAGNRMQFPLNERQHGQGQSMNPRFGSDSVMGDNMFNVRHNEGFSMPQKSFQHPNQHLQPQQMRFASGNNQYDFERNIDLSPDFHGNVQTNSIAQQRGLSSDVDMFHASPRNMFDYKAGDQQFLPKEQQLSMSDVTDGLLSQLNGGLTLSPSQSRVKTFNEDGPSSEIMAHQLSMESFFDFPPEKEVLLSSSPTVNTSLPVSSLSLTSDHVQDGLDLLWDKNTFLSSEVNGLE